MKVGNIAKMAQQMQAQMAQVQDELREASVDASAGGGAVRVVVSGDQVLRSVEIDRAAVDPDDVEMLQDLIVAAVNDGVAQSKKLAEEKMSRVAGSIGLPGLPGLG